jgi:hypothetical protein
MRGRRGERGGERECERGRGRECERERRERAGEGEQEREQERESIPLLGIDEWVLGSSLGIFFLFAT